MFKKQRKFVIGGAVIFLAIGYLIFVGFQSSATYFYTVSELLAKGNSVYGEKLRVSGQVTPGSVEVANGRIVRFVISDITQGVNLSVAFGGIVPDTFKPGNEAVVEGYLDSAGIFQAQTVMPKCPSRYQPA